METNQRLMSIAQRYISERDNSPEYNAHLTRTVRHLCDYVGEDVMASRLEYALVNRWLESILERRSKQCAKLHKRCLITLWNYAAESGIVDWPHTRRIKRIKERPRPPVAFTREEISALVDASNKLAGDYGPLSTRREYWRALIIGAYDLGFRRADMLTLPREIIDGKPFVWTEHKTGVTQCRVLSEMGREALEAITHPSLAYPWTRSMTAFRRTFERIKRHAGIQHGSFKWLRRSHGTYAGTLGHKSSDIFQRHYLDPSVNATPTSPGPLE